MRTDEESLSPEEKIKQLIEVEEEKREQIEKKKQELEKKKKEIETLEEQNEQEIQEARRKINEELEELKAEEKERFEEEERLRRQREAEAASLEETIEEETGASQAEQEAAPRGYNEVFEEIRQGIPGFYELTNYNVVNRLESIAQEAGNRALTKDEQSFIETIQYHAERMGRDEFYKNKDQSNYLAKELAEIDHIKKKSREFAEMKSEYNI